MKSLIILTAICVLLLSACSPDGTIEPDPLPPINIDWVEDLAPSGWVLFQDDFSDPHSGWVKSDDPDGSRRYHNEAFVFSITRPGWYYWATPNLTFTDVHIDAQMTPVGDNGISAQGLFCRYQDEQNFYAFTLTNDGYFGITKVQNGVEKLLGSDVLIASSDIHTGQAMNFIGIDCIEDTLTLWINGAQALSVLDASFRQGEVGVIGTVLEGPQAVIEFDNFSVIKP